MDETNLTTNDLNVLLDALDAYERKDMAGDMMGDLVGMMMNKEDTIEEKAATLESERQKRVGRDRAIKEQSILLKGKLIKLRNKIQVETYCNNES